MKKIQSLFLSSQGQIEEIEEDQEYFFFEDTAGKYLLGCPKFSSSFLATLASTLVPLGAGKHDFKPALLSDSG